MGVGRAPAWVGCNTRVAHPVLLCSPKCGTRRVRPCFVCLCFRPLPICVCICVPCRLCLLALPSRSAGVSSPLLSWGLFRSCASSPVPSLRTSDELAHSIPLPLYVSPHRTGLSVESWLDPARTLVMVASTRCRCVCVCVCVCVRLCVRVCSFTSWYGCCLLSFAATAFVGGTYLEAWCRCGRGGTATKLKMPDLLLGGNAHGVWNVLCRNTSPAATSIYRLGVRQGGG